MNISITPRSFQGTEKFVDPAMFQANYLFHRNSTENIEALLDQIPLTGLRWPGGAVAEQFFDIANPDRIPPGFDEFSSERHTSLSQFLEFAHQQHLSVTIVIPTRVSLNSAGEVDQSFISDLKGFVERIISQTSENGEYSNASIYAFEIGNEYWGNDLSSSQYGLIANEISVALQGTLDNTLGSQADQPKILVQMGVPVASSRDFSEGGILHDLSPGSEKALELGLSDRSFNNQGELRWGEKIRVLNEEIINQLSADARSAIDGLVEHYYFNWSEDYQLPEVYDDQQLVRSIDQKLEVWRSNGFEDHGLHLTEWNVMAANHSQLGQIGAGVKIAQMSYMIQMGAESAFSWPAQHNTTNSLGGKFDAEPELTPLGGAMSLMAEYLPGTQFIENGFSDPRFSLFTFGTEDTLYGFLISRSAEEHDVEIRLTDFSNINADVKLSSLYVESDGRHWLPGRGVVDAEIYEDHDALSVLSVVDPEINSDELVSLSVSPFEIIFIEITNTAEPIYNEISGSQFGDLLEGTFGADRIRGGDGDDTIFGGFGNDILFGLGGDDLIYGGAGNDTIWGGDGNDTIHGGSGSNYLAGGPGNDLIFGGDGTDTIWGGVGNDTIFGGDGGSRIGGGDGRDLIFGGNGNDTIWGGHGNDTIHGGDGQDLLHGGPGNDQLFGGPGADTLYGAAGNDMLRGGWGDDLLFGGSGNDTLHGGPGNDTLHGDSGDNLLFGGDGDDLIYGGSGNDTIRGGAGDDTLSGGGGANRFEFFPNQDTNLILDFDAPAGDVLAISRWMLPADQRNLSSAEIFEIFGSSMSNGDILLDFGSTRILLRDIPEGEDIDESLIVF